MSIYNKKNKYLLCIKYKNQHFNIQYKYSDIISIHLKRLHYYNSQQGNYIKSIFLKNLNQQSLYSLHTKQYLNIQNSQLDIKYIHLKWLNYYQILQDNCIMAIFSMNFNPLILYRLCIKFHLYKRNMFLNTFYFILLIMIIRKNKQSL